MANTLFSDASSSVSRLSSKRIAIQSIPNLIMVVSSRDLDLDPLHLAIKKLFLIQENV